MRETWYIMADGTAGDPRECKPDENGVLRNKDGMPVAMKGEVPHTSGVEIEAEKQVPMTIGEAAVDNKNVEAAEAGVEAEMAAAEQVDANKAEAAAEAKPAVVEKPVDVPVEPVEPVETQAKTAKNREMKAAVGKKYKTR